MTPPSTDILERLELAAQTHPALTILREAAQHIRNLQQEVDHCIVLTSSTGEEIARVEGAEANWLVDEAVKRYTNHILREALNESQ